MEEKDNTSREGGALNDDGSEESREYQEWARQKRLHRQGEWITEATE